MTRDLAADLQLARELATEARELVRAMATGGVGVAATKSSPVDVVTAADRAAEALIRERLRELRPHDALMGEEGEDESGTTGQRWVIDPIDGTVNYLYGLPGWCVSVALQAGETSLVGVVATADGAVFTAVSGQGAHLDGERLAVRAPVPLAQRLIATGFHYDAELRAVQGAATAAMLPRVRDVRRIGSCALDLCLVAAGHLDGYVEEGTSEWDRAAGKLIATEAGATFEVWEGAGGRDLIVCAPTPGFAEFATLVRECGYGGNNAGVGRVGAQDDTP